MRSAWLVAVSVIVTASIPFVVLPIDGRGAVVVAVIAVAVLFWAYRAWRRERTATAISRPATVASAPNTLAELGAVDSELGMAAPSLGASRSLPRVLVMTDGGSSPGAFAAATGEVFGFATTNQDRPLGVWVGNRAVWFGVAARVTADPSLATVLRAILHRLRVQTNGLALDGVVIELAADKLGALSENDADALGKRLRTNIDAVRAESGIEACVYIVATGIERLQGFSAAVQGLHPSERAQVLGVTVPLSIEPERRVGFVDEGLRDTSTNLVRRVSHNATWRTAVTTRELGWQFAQWVDGLRPPLVRVVNALSDASLGPPPLVRGVYLGSLADHGSPLGQPVTQARGWFVADLLGGIIIRDKEFAKNSSYEKTCKYGARRLFAVWLGCAAALGLVFAGWSWRVNSARVDAVSTALDRSILRPPPEGADAVLLERVRGLRAGERESPWYERLGFGSNEDIAVQIDRALRPRSGHGRLAH